MLIVKKSKSEIKDKAYPKDGNQQIVHFFWVGLFLFLGGLVLGQFGGMGGIFIYSYNCNSLLLGSRPFQQSINPNHNFPFPPITPPPNPTPTPQLQPRNPNPPSTPITHNSDKYLLLIHQSTSMQIPQATALILLFSVLTQPFQGPAGILHRLLDERVGEGAREWMLQENMGGEFYGGQEQMEGERMGLGFGEGRVDGNRSVVEQMLVYSAKFRKLNFDLDENELRGLAYDVRDLYARDKTALFFISAYFIRACQKLQQDRVPAPQITKLIKRKIKTLMNIASIQTYRKQKYGESTLHALNLTSNYWQSIEQSIMPMTFKKFALQPEDKDRQIEDIVMSMVQEAQSHFQIFNYLTRSICQGSHGLTHHVNFKIRSKEERTQMKRVKEKLLRKFFAPHNARCLNTFLNIGWKRKIEQSGFQDLLNKVYSQLHELQFSVKDLLRAKCMFPSVAQIHSAALSLLSSIQTLQQNGHKIKLIEFENRLHNITCDIMLIVQIDSLPCEIQLSLDFDQNLFEISHKMYELGRSRVFSPVVLLFEWFEKIAPEFLYRMGLGLGLRGRGDGRGMGSERLVKEYALLNQFFHLTAYMDLDRMSEQEFEREMEQEILRVKEEIIQPFTKLGGFF